MVDIKKEVEQITIGVTIEKSILEKPDQLEILKVEIEKALEEVLSFFKIQNKGA